MKTKKTETGVIPEKELIKKQAERIEELRAENRNLEEALAEYRRREKEIVDALAFAKKQGDEYVSLVRVKYALECDRLKRFREKLRFFGSREELIKGYDNAFRELREWQNDLEKTIAEDFGEAMNDYLEERKRLGDEPNLNYASIATQSENPLADADEISDDDLKELLDQI